MTTFRGKILVIRGGAIGDFILTLPAIAALRRNFPEAYIEVLGYPHIIQLAVAGGLVDCARSIEARALAGFFARNGPLAEDLAYYFSEFDIIVSYLYDPDSIFRANIARCSPAQFIWGPHRPDEKSRMHAVKVFLKPLERLAIFDADSVPHLHVREGRGVGVGAGGTEAEQHKAGCGLEVAGPKRRPVLALHPGSGAERKNWPESKWAELLEQVVHGTDFDLMLVGGEAEGERLQRLGAALPPLRTRVAQSLPLAELAGLLAASTGFIGHDSGISHLAAAVGLPAIILWGETAEEVWRPPSEKAVLVRDPGGLGRLSTRKVFETMQRLWAVRFNQIR